jgi:hypothetical protein
MRNSRPDAGKFTLSGVTTSRDLDALTFADLAAAAQPDAVAPARKLSDCGPIGR